MSIILLQFGTQVSRSTPSPDQSGIILGSLTQDNHESFRRLSYREGLAGPYMKDSQRVEIESSAPQPITLTCDVMLNAAGDRREED